MSYKKSSFNVSDDIIKHIAENHIDLAIEVLNLLVGKTVSEIENICFVVRKIASENSKL